MNYLKKIVGRLFATPQKEYYTFNVRCKRYGENLPGRVDVDNDLSVEYASNGDAYFCRKVLMGDGKNMCYQQVEVELRFNSQRKLLERKIVSGGDFTD